MRKCFFPGLVTIIILHSFNAYTQLAIIGPECVLSGVQYQYNINGNIPPQVKLCIKGGKLSDSSACASDLSLGFIKIIWTGDKGSISLTSDSGNFSAEVFITLPLQPGNIDSTYRKQFIKYQTVPLNISCSKSSGGGCGPSYSFQWQQSLNNLDWQDVPGATQQNLIKIRSLTETTFYRRRTVENISGSIVYSDAAVVYVAPEITGN